MLSGVVQPGKEIGRAMARRFTDDRVTGLAAEVAFWWVFTVFPALLVLAAVLVSLDRVVGADVEQEVESEIVDALVNITGSSDNTAVENVRQLFDSNSAGVLTVGVLLGLWSTSRSFTALIAALNELYRRGEHRTYVQVRARGLALAAASLVTGALALALLVVGPLLGAGSDLAADVGVGSAWAVLWDWLRLPAALGLLVVWCAMLFRYAPHRPDLADRSWRVELPGALLAAVLAVLATLGVSFYTRFGGSSSIVFSVLGGALVLMIWFYAVAVAVLCGAVLNSVLAGRRTG